jgi:glutamyl-tRNA reductase
MRKNVPVLKSIKNKLHAMHNCNLYIDYIARQDAAGFTTTSTATKIQKVVNGMAIQMRSHNQKGCSYIAAINEFIATGTN